MRPGRHTASGGKKPLKKRETKVLIHSRHLQGLSRSRIVCELNGHGFPPARGKLFHPVQVQGLSLGTDK